MTHDELRQILYSLLSDLVGTYSDGGPAVTDRPAGRPGPDVRATGLEVVISTDPDNRGFATHHHSRSRSLVWVVFLVQHGTGQLSQATDRVLDRFPDATLTQVSVGLPDIPAQVRAEIPI